MLLDRIRTLLRPAESPDDRGRTTAGQADSLHVAACALLLDVAYADGEFSTAEREHLEQSLERHFGLAPSLGREVIALAEAERARAVDHFTFTSALLRGYDVTQRVALAEAMWGLVLADGQVAEHEHYLTRKIANFLELAPEQLAAAKQAAAAR